MLVRRCAVLTKALTPADINSILATVTNAPMRRAFLADIRGVIEVLGQSAIGQTGARVTFDMANPRVRRYLETTAARNVVRVTRATRTSIRRALVSGTRAGEGASALAARISTVFTQSRGFRSVRIARTETVAAQSFATDEGYGQAGVERKEWLSNRDNDVRDTHAPGTGLDGDVVAQGEDFTSPSGATGPGPGLLGSASEDINCLLPGTSVRGAYVAGLRAFYAGQAIEIETAGGNRLRVTANHPVLTAEGFAAAHTLREGMDVLSDLPRVEATSSRAIREHVDHGPAAVEQVFGALTSGRLSKRRRLHAVDLDGDELSMKGKVDVKSVERKLLDHRYPSRPQSIEDRLLASADVLTVRLTGLGGANHVGVAASAAAPSLPHGAALALYGSPTHVEPLVPLRFGVSAYAYPSLYEASGDRGPADAETVRELLEGRASPVRLDRIVKVRSFEYVGHVYDLQSVDGWIIAEGVLVGNCRCVLLPRLEERAFADTEDKRVIVWTAMDRRRLVFQRKLQRRVRTVFSGQKADVLRALRRAF